MTENAAGSDSQQGEDLSSGSDNKQQMIKRVIGQRDQARNDAATESQINQDLLERNMNLQRQIDVLQAAGSNNSSSEFGEEPTLENCGGDEAKFKKEYGRYLQTKNNAGGSGNSEEIAKKVLQDHLDTQTAEADKEAFRDSVNKHYDRAQEMGVSDYEQAETDALSILGADILDGIVSKIPNSEQLIYMLGKKPDEAKRIKALFQKDSGAATIEIGRLSAAAEAFKDNSASGPEASINYGGKPDGEMSALERQLDKAYEAASETGDLTEVRRIRNQIRELEAKQ